jgi:hypothetical protein
MMHIEKRKKIWLSNVKQHDRVEKPEAEADIGP